MKSLDCIFCKIVAGQVPTTIIKETDDLIVIKDRAPKAPIHYLIIPKNHVENIQAASSEDLAIGASIFLMAKKLSSELSENQDFKLVMNNGFKAGQRVFHMHVHFLAGADDMPE
ncbi:MAG: HIT domain-containing protein [Bacteroidota bacterium]